MLCVRFPLQLTHLPAKPCPFNHHCSSPASPTSFQAQSLASHSDHILLSLTAHLPPPPHSLKPNHSSPTQPHFLGPTTHLPPSTRSFRGQSLVSHIHQASSFLATCFPHNHVNSSTTAHVLPLLHPLKPDRSSPTLHQVISGPATCLPPNIVNLSPTACVPPSPNSFQA